MADPTVGKFQPNLKGPAESYALNKLDEASVPIMWIAMHLKRYY